MKRRPTKIITRVIVFLMLGAIVNVAVAWGCATIDVWNLLIESSSWGDSSMDDRWNWTTEARSVAGASRIKSHWQQYDEKQFDYVKSLYDDWSEEGLIRPPPPAHELLPFGLRSRAQSQKVWRMFDCRGWPCLAVWCEVREIDVTEMPGKWRGGIGLSRTTQSDSRVLPYFPIWSGFAINTIFYAAILWMLFAFPFVLRRKRRIKRGLCPACAYPVGTSKVCTECGNAVMPRSVGTA